MNSNFKVFESVSTEITSKELPEFILYLDEKQLQENADNEKEGYVLKSPSTNTSSETKLSFDEYQEYDQLEQLETELPNDFEDFVEKCLDEDQYLINSGKYRHRIMAKPNKTDDMPSLSDFSQIDCAFSEKPIILRPQELERKNIYKDIKNPKLDFKFKEHFKNSKLKQRKSLSSRMSNLPRKQEKKPYQNLQGEPVDESQSQEISVEYSKSEVITTEQISHGQAIIPEQKETKIPRKKRKLVGSSKDVKLLKKPFKCKICDNVYTVRSDLKCHLETHEVFKKPRILKIKKTEFPCDQCDYVARHERNLKKHKLTHLKLKIRHNCSFCSYSSTTFLILQKHEEQHKNTPFFPCKTCSFKAKTLESLRNHNQLHVDEKVFKCTECPHSFYRKSSLTEHMRKHNGLDQIKCDLCPSTFSRKSNMLAHKRKFH